MGYGHVQMGLADALDALFEAMKDKNPGVRKETVGALARAIAQTKPAVARTVLKRLGPALTAVCFAHVFLHVLNLIRSQSESFGLVQAMEDGAGEVREAGFEACGNLLKVRPVRGGLLRILVEAYIQWYRG